MSVYDYTVKDRMNNDVSLSQFKGKVMVIVNTATGCGFTPQYEGLEMLWKKYHDKGLEILDFPCNQFGNQAPESDEGIHQFCQMKYNTSFDNYKKIDVNGPDAIPLYTYLKSQKSFAGFTGDAAEFMNNHVAKIDPDFKNNSEIKWNFTKFIINRQGEVAARFESTTTPEELEAYVEKLI
ncbi:glutathione peroxidase [Treponema sp.]|uniref:glutathione peroxidase n=1 Tax=Treponema sp. TaxID=166 RepID=UPI0025EC10C0|nr:glutathione peroxidase [Treponema sp.]MCR5219046.1 glutathione peroxidase [Treponema sp.]